MLLQDVLQLEKVQGSIKKIDLFLVSQIKLSDEYLKALAYKAMILHTIGKTNEALKLLFNMVPSFKEMNVEGIIAICDGIIDICLDLKRYDQVSKYIKIKQNYLPISKSVLHVRDNIKYFLAIQKYDEAKEALLKYLEDDLTKEESIFAKEELSKIYYMERQYDKYLSLIPDLENYYQSNLALTQLAELNLNKLKIAFEQGNYLKVINDGTAYIHDDTLKEYNRLAIATLLMKSYLIGNDYKRAGIIESDYCEYISLEHKEDSLAFCMVALELYTKTNTLVSITEYRNKIKELEASKKEEKTLKKKVKKEEVVIPILHDEEEEVEETPVLLTKEEPQQEQVQQVIHQTVEQVKNVVVSENYDKLIQVFNSINELDLQVKFREIFRICCIKLCEVFKIEEVYLLYYKRGYLGLHYKKERAYDKKLSFDQIEGTLSFASMNFDAEAFLDSENDIYNKDIITGQVYTMTPYGFALPLRDSLKPIGSIAFFSKETFLDVEMNYESLKLISSMLNTRLLMSLRQDELEFDNRKLFFIHQNMSSGVKEEIDGYLHFSSECCKILGVLENMTEEDYLYKMKPEDIMLYRRVHEELYTLLSENVVLEYEFKKEQEWIKIRERYYPMVMDGVICILSLIDDITLQEQNKKELIHLAYKNPISKLDTEVKLMVDLSEYYSAKKLSLAVIDIIDFNLYRELYGYNFANQLIYTVGQELVRAFENDFNILVYHLEADRYVVLFKEVNDKRIIDSKLNMVFKVVSERLFQLNSRVKLNFTAGVYRMARHSNIDEPSKILYYALDALDDAKTIESYGNHIAHFDSDLHKKKFNENSLITHISESIDHAKLSLTYKQIVDLKKNEVFGYHILLNLDNYEVDYAYMEFVIRRRNLTIQLEKYAISGVFKELRMMKDALKGYILCFVNVSADTLEENFYNFIETQQSFYKVPREYVVLVVSSAESKIVKKLREAGYKIASFSIFDVYNECCDYFICDFHKLLPNAIEEVRGICKNHNVFCIIHQMNTKEDIEFAKEQGYEAVYGDYYKRATRMKSILEKINN